MQCISILCNNIFLKFQGWTRGPHTC
jgi:hypothetical protein